MSQSSTTTAKLYVGTPSSRTMIRSSISLLPIVIGPLTRSSHVTSPSAGLAKRTTGFTPAGTAGSVLPGSGRHVPS